MIIPGRAATLPTYKIKHRKNFVKEKGERVMDKIILPIIGIVLDLIILGIFISSFIAERKKDERD